MSARKSIAKVQLGSVTPDKSSLQSKGVQNQGGGDVVSLPYINVHNSQLTQTGDTSPTEIRSAEKPTGAKNAMAGRPVRGTILQKPPPISSLSGKSNSESTEDNPRTSRPSILNKPPNVKSDSAIEEQQNFRISRPSILNKQFVATKASAGTPAAHSPSAPSQPKSSSRLHRGTVLKHMPQGQQTEIYNEESARSDLNRLVSNKAREVVQDAFLHGISCYIKDLGVEFYRSNNSGGESIQDVAKMCISISIRNALHNISLKG